MVKESNLPNTVLCNHLSLCIISKKIYNVTGKFHHFVFNDKYSYICTHKHKHTHTHTHTYLLMQNRFNCQNESDIQKELLILNISTG